MRSAKTPSTSPNRKPCRKILQCCSRWCERRRARDVIRSRLLLKLFYQMCILQKKVFTVVVATFPQISILAYVVPQDMIARAMVGVVTLLNRHNVSQHDVRRWIFRFCMWVVRATYTSRSRRQGIRVMV